MNLRAILLTFALVSCSPPGVRDAGPPISDAGSDAGTETPSLFDAGPLSGSNFQLLLAEEVCRLHRRCGRSTDQLARQCRYRVSSFFAEAPKLFAAGALSFDSAAAGRCLSLIGKLDCADSWNPLACATGIYAPAGTTGSVCGRGTCVEGGCPYSFANPDNACFRCTAFAPVGAVCLGRDAGICATDAWCDTMTSRCTALGADGAFCRAPQLCLSQACTYLEDGGAPRCGVATAGTPCRYSDDCGPSGFCDGLRHTENGTLLALGQCRARVANGVVCEPQQFGNPCAAFGAQCVDRTCQSVVPLSRPLGAECQKDEECIGGWCRGSSTTYEPDAGPNDFVSRCAAANEAGEPCGTGRCGAGLSCNGPPFICRPISLPGRFCGADAGDCATGSVCIDDGDPRNATCVPLPRLGQSCEDFKLPCIEGYCGAGRLCQNWIPDGTACFGNSSCRSGRCISIPDGGKACVEACR